MITLKREQMFLNYTFNLKWWNYNWVFREITKSFTFKYFQKTELYLEPIQTSKMELFVKIVNSLMPLTILTKRSILDVWLGSENTTKIFNKSFCEFKIFSFSSHLVKYFFAFYFVNFYYFQYLKTIFKFSCTRLIFIQTNIYVKTYTFLVVNFSLSLR